jgi:riboflavin kinase/FMN adenylyltransferase
MYFNKNIKNFRISNQIQKINLLKKFDVDFVIIKKFDKNFSKIKSVDFIEKILKKN